jgi:adenylate kinase
MSVASPVPPPWPAILLVGPTGSGKSPLGDELEQRGLCGRRCAHLDFGANLRRAARGGAGEFDLRPSEIARIRASLASGALFEAEDLPMIVKILRRFAASRVLGPGELLVLNGLPRHRDQAEALAPLLAVERVISLVADAVVIQARIRLDSGGDRAGRADDSLEAVARRLEIFGQRTAPLIAYYEDRRVPVTAILVTAGMTSADMLARLDRRLRCGVL